MERVDRLSSHVISSGERRDKPLVVTIIGAGNSGHVCSSLFHDNMKGNIIVQLMTSRPDNFTQHPTVVLPNGSQQTGFLTKISKNPQDLIPGSDVLLWTGPVNSTKVLFETIKPYCRKDVIIGTIFAQGLIHLLASRIFGEQVRFFALRNIPWLCRTVTPGKHSEVVGPKTKIEVATINLSEKWVIKNLQPLFEVTSNDGTRIPVIEMMPDFTPIVFNPANQIIHPARYWALFKNYVGVPLKEEPSTWLYRGMGEDAGVMLEILDEELQCLKTKYALLTKAEGCKMVIPLRDRLIIQYGNQISDHSTLAKMVSTNKAYSMAKTPMVKTDRGYLPKPDHRVVQDDIGWGLCVLISIAENLALHGVKTPTTVMRMMVEWHQKLMGKEFLINGELKGRDCKDLVLLHLTDPPEVAANVMTPQRFLELDDHDERTGNP